MKICVITGSPKGKNSISFQTALFLQKKFPMDSFSFFHAGHRARVLEKDMSPALEAIKDADILLFCYPVYSFLVPSQFHRFIELLKGSGADLSGKYAAQICTSKHFFDVTAMRFIRDNIADMGMKYLGEFSADMEDLLTAKGRHDAFTFWKLVRFRYKKGITVPLRTAAPKKKTYVSCLEETPKKEGYDTVIVASLDEKDSSLSAMIEDFCRVYPYSTRLVNIAAYPFSGGCLGCYSCAASGKCVYRDGFDEFLRREIQSADAIVYAYTVTDHSMGSKMKLFDDRQFCNGHRTVTAGKPVGYIVNGDLDNEENLRILMEARSETGGNYLAGTADSAEDIKALADTLGYALRLKLHKPDTFYGVGGHKIFRDLIWTMQGMMKADHEFYMKNGLYDFPQYRTPEILKMKLVGTVFSSPELMRKAGDKITEGMLAPYVKVIEEADKEE